MLPRLTEVFVLCESLSPERFRSRFPDVYVALHNTSDYARKTDKFSNDLQQFLKKTPFGESDLLAAQKMMSNIKGHGIQYFTGGSAPVKQDASGNYAIDFTGKWPPATEEIYYTLFVETVADKEDFEDMLSQISPELSEKADEMWPIYEKLTEGFLMPWQNLIMAKRPSAEA